MRFPMYAIYGRTQLGPVVRARHAEWARLHLAGWRVSDIARSFGRDPTTVSEALSKKRARVIHAR